jgi:hypothetical protein
MPDIVATRLSRRGLFGKLGLIAAGVAAAAALPAPSVEAAPDLERQMPLASLQSLLTSMENVGLIAPDYEIGVHERRSSDEVLWMLRRRELVAGDPGYVWGVAASGPGDVARLTAHYSALVDRGLMRADEAGYRLNRAVGETHETAQRYAGWWASAAAAGARELGIHTARRA